MVHGLLKDWSKAVATGFSKNRSKTTQKLVQTTQKPVFLHFIDVFHIKGVSDSMYILCIHCRNYVQVITYLFVPYFIQKDQFYTPLRPTAGQN